MPELPEVETTRRGLAPHLTGRRIAEVVVRDPRLRWPVPADLRGDLVGATVQAVGRRAKYLLIATDRGTLIIHLGMSGSLRVLQGAAQARKHDHVDILLEEGALVRYTDPRRFGAMLWWTGEPEQHPLLAELGPEPWAEEFNADYLYRISRGRRCAVKTLIMDSRIVAGVGNIYASEALFAAGILPARAAGRISRERYADLVREVQQVLRRAVELGGTTLRDFTGAEGRPGYFRQTLNVYGREGLPCRECGGTLRGRRIGQRASVYCARCQR